jgi:hypothetical protein
MKDDRRSCRDHISVFTICLCRSLAQGALRKGSLRDQHCPRRRRYPTSLKNQSGLCPGEALLKADKWTGPCGLVRILSPCDGAVASRPVDHALPRSSLRSSPRRDFKNLGSFSRPSPRERYSGLRNGYSSEASRSRPRLEPRFARPAKPCRRRRDKETNSPQRPSLNHPIHSFHLRQLLLQPV